MTERDQEELFLSPESGRTSQWRWPLSGDQKETFRGAGAGQDVWGLGLRLMLSWSTGFFAGVPRCPPSGVPKVLGPEEKLQEQEGAVVVWATGRASRRKRQTGLGRARDSGRNSPAHPQPQGTVALRMPTMCRQRATSSPVRPSELAPEARLQIPFIHSFITLKTC